MRLPSIGRAITAARRVWRKLESFHYNQVGDLLQDILKIALIALPALVILFVLFRMFCPEIMAALEAIGVVDEDARLPEWCQRGD